MTDLDWRLETGDAIESGKKFLLAFLRAKLRLKSGARSVENIS